MKTRSQNADSDKRQITNTLVSSHEFLSKKRLNSCTCIIFYVIMHALDDRKEQSYLKLFIYLF